MKAASHTEHPACLPRPRPPGRVLTCAAGCFRSATLGPGLRPETIPRDRGKGGGLARPPRGFCWSRLEPAWRCSIPAVSGCCGIMIRLACTRACAQGFRMGGGGTAEHTIFAVDMLQNQQILYRTCRQHFRHIKSTYVPQGMPVCRTACPQKRFARGDRGGSPR